MAIQRSGGMEPLASAGLPAAAIDYVDAEYSEVRGRQLRDYARILYKYRWLAATSFCATIGLTLLVTLLTPRLYSATTRLQLAREAPIQLQLKDNVLNLDDGDRSVSAASTFIATQVATLKSRDLAERVIRTHGLAANEAFLHPGSERPGLLAVGGHLLSFLRPRGFGSSRVGSADDDDALPTADAPTKLLDRYMSYLDVRDVRGTDLIDVRFTTPTAELSAMLAAAHAQAYLEANTEARLATDVEAKEFLGKQLEDSRGRLARSEDALKRFSGDHPNVAVNQEQKLITQRIAEITTQLSGAEAERIAQQTQYDLINKPGTDQLAHFLDRPSLEKLYAAMLDLRAQRAAFDPRLGPNHPQMVQLREQENEVKRQITAEVSQQVAAVRAHYDTAVARETGLRTRLAYLEESAVVLRDLGARYDILKADLDNAQELHRTLLKQAMETAVNSQLAASNIRVIERAEVPAAPSRPNLPLNLVVGLVAGLGMALGATVVCESFDNSVKSTADVESQLQLPTLGTIPNFALVKRSMPKALEAPVAANAMGAEPPGGARSLVVVREPWSPVAESFRSVRTAVLFSTPEAPPKVILLTSAGASEGKTVTSLNLAATLAEAGSRVLLIDADLRRPTCHYSLGVENTRGLSSFLAGQAELKDVIVDLEQPRLHFVAGGPTPPNPAEMVGSARMREALAGFRESYDFVIVDSPPVVPVTDAVVLSREADAVVLVVKGHDTPLELVRRARDQLTLANAHIIGAVINNVDLRWGDLYHYQRFYGYYRNAESAVRAS